MNDAAQLRLERLVDWAQAHGARLHPSLEIYHDDITKLSLRVKPQSPAPLEPGFKAVSCPFGITLSYLNALVDGPLNPSHPRPHDASHRGPAFPPSFMAAVPPHVIGRFYLIQQYLKGSESFWWPYISSLPSPLQVNSWVLPPFWQEDDLEFLAGTNADVAVAEIQENVKAEFKQARKILKDESFPDWQGYNRLLYNWAFCIFTSRSFRPSLLISPETNETIRPILPVRCDLDDFSILQPLFDIANHSITAKYTWDIATDPHSCQLVCGDAYRPGEQVFNNYGLKTNSELLLGYGFILPETPTLHNDYVHVRARPQEDAAEDSEPKDFLISLRPMADASSLVGRARPPKPRSTRFYLLPEFSHFEPSLIQDLTSQLSAPVDREILEASPDEVTWKKPPPGGLVELIKQMLSGKLGYDYQKLKEADPLEEDPEGGEPREAQPTNQYQELALAYRKQYEKVLLAAMRALGVPSDGGDAGGTKGT